MLPHTTGVLPSHGTLPSVDFAAHADSTLVDGAARLIPIVQGEALELPVSALTRDGLLEALEAVGAKGSHGEICLLYTSPSPRDRG